MNLFPNPTYNNQFLKGGSTSAPIAGTCLLTAYKRPLSQAKISVDNMIQGDAVVLKNKALAKKSNNKNDQTNIQTNSNNDGLSGNVFIAESVTTTTTIDGFIVNSPNDILLDGDSFPRFLKNQIARVAVIGSGAEVYLPANSNLEDKALSQTLYWDNTNKELTTTTTTTIELKGVKIMGQLVNGVVPKYDSSNNVVSLEKKLVIKVKL